MGTESTSGAPDVGRHFEKADRGAEPDWHLEHDAAEWEPVDEPTEKHLTLDYTPGGALEYEVHSEMEAAKSSARQGDQQERTIGIPDERELDFAGDFDSSRRDELSNDFRRQTERNVDWEALVDERFGEQGCEREQEWER